MTKSTSIISTVILATIIMFFNGSHSDAINLYIDGGAFFEDDNGDTHDPVNSVLFTGSVGLGLGKSYELSLEYSQLRRRYKDTGMEDTYEFPCVGLSKLKVKGNKFIKDTLSINLFEFQPSSIIQILKFSTYFGYKITKKTYIFYGVGADLIFPTPFVVNVFVNAGVAFGNFSAPISSVK
jgi:hypothetical protein